MTLQQKAPRDQTHRQVGRCDKLGIPGFAGRPGKEVIVMVAVFWITGIVACCALCGWGIATAVRRSKERRTRALTH